MKKSEQEMHDLIMKSDFKKKLNVFFRKLRFSHFVAVQQADDLLLQDEKINYGRRHNVPCNGLIWYTKDDFKDIINCVCFLSYKAEAMNESELIDEVSKVAYNNGLKAEKVNGKIAVSTKIA